MNGVLEQKLVEYLLGGLPPEERAEIEEGLFTDDELDDALQATRDDLIHAYLAATLSPQDRERFESHFLASDRHRGRLAFIRDLLSAVDHVSRERRPLKRHTWLAAAAILLIVSSALVLAFRILQQELYPTGSPKDEMQARTWIGQPTGSAGDEADVSDGKRPARAMRPAPTSVQSVRLSHRSGLEPVEVVLASETSVLRVHVPLPQEMSAPSYDVILHGLDSREVWRKEELPAAGGEVVLDVPIAVLTAADYRLSVQPKVLRGSGPGPSFQDFYLRVLPPR